MAGHVISYFLQLDKTILLDTISRTSNFIKYNLNNEYFLDLTNDYKKLRPIIDLNKYDFIINCVGLLVKDSNEFKDNAILLNSFLPHYIETLTEKSKTKIIQISTDCVFSGKKGRYIESDQKDGNNFYDISKSIGEINNKKDLTIRTSIIGPELKKSGTGLLNWFYNESIDLKPIQGYSQVHWNGMTTINLYRIIKLSIEKNLSGIYHSFSNEVVSKYQLLGLFSKIFFNSNQFISKNDLIISDKTLATINNPKLIVLDSFENQIIELKKFIQLNLQIYPNYNK